MWGSITCATRSGVEGRKAGGSEGKRRRGLRCRLAAGRRGAWRRRRGGVSRERGCERRALRRSRSRPSTSFASLPRFRTKLLGTAGPCVAHEAARLSGSAGGWQHPAMWFPSQSDCPCSLARADGRPSAAMSQHAACDYLRAAADPGGGGRPHRLGWGVGEVRLRALLPPPGASHSSRDVLPTLETRASARGGENSGGRLPQGSRDFGFSRR